MHDFSRSTLVSAQEFLNKHPLAGRPLRLPHLGLMFYGLKDVLSLGGSFQVLMPELQGKLPHILLESCQYLSGEHKLVPAARSLLQTGTEIVDVDEAAALYLPEAHNLWHWTFEVLPKLLALESIGYGGKYITSDSPDVRRSFAMFDIDPSRLLNGQGIYRVKRMMVPERLSGFHLVERMPLVEFLRDGLIRAAGSLPGSKRVYVKRIGRRKPINEDEVLSVLDDFDFEVMIPEELELREEWRYMTNVDCSVMAHGANTTLTLLQKPRSGLVEFFSNRYVSYTSLHTARLLKMNYRPLVQDLDVSSVPLNSMTFSEFMWSGYEADMLVDTMHLRIILESLCE